MAGQAYLTFFDDAPGEATVIGHENWIELRSWSWGVTATRGPVGGAGGAAGGAGTGRPDPSALVWVHAFDAASTRLLRFVASGAHVRKAELHVVHTVGHGGREAWLAVLMDEVVITSVVTTGTADGAVEQAVGMEFRSVKFAYRRQRPDGSLGEPATVTWDIAAGTVSSTP